MMATVIDGDITTAAAGNALGKGLVYNDAGTL